MSKSNLPSWLKLLIFVGVCVCKGGSTKCSKNEDCGASEACVMGTCVNPCTALNCKSQPHRDCLIYNHRAECKCIEGYKPSKDGCVPGGPPCTSNNTCNSNETCQNGFCYDPCLLASCSGIPNSVCVVIDHKLSCKCPPGYKYQGDQGCVLTGKKCSSNDNCDSTELCANGLCVDPCSVTRCPLPNMVCLVLNHKAMCRCKPGFQQTKDGCVPGGKPCSSNASCDATEACLEGFCSDPCKDAHCGANGVCLVRNHEPKCKCKPGYIVKGNDCVPGGKPCSSNDGCSANETCSKGICTDPCADASCGENGVCYVTNHEANCKCKPGYIVKGNGCVPGGKACSNNDACGATETCKNGFCSDPCEGATCPPNSKCNVVNHVAKCKCNPGYKLKDKQCLPGGKPCSNNDACGATESCKYGFCSDPCESATCPPNAKCKVVNHTAKCKCNPGYKLKNKECVPGGNPCSNNDGCGETERCKNGFCSNPCEGIKCPPTAKCIVLNHEPKCKCNNGYRAKGKECVPGKKCSSNDNCDSTEVCVVGKCADACSLTKCTSPNTVCLVLDHKAMCRCKPGYQQTKDGCVPGGKPCSSNDSCGANETCSQGFCINPCAHASCGANGVCYVRNHEPKCKCKPGFKVKGKACVPGGKSCSSNDGCDATETCSQGICSDPCADFKCGPNSVCYVSNHVAKCGKKCSKSDNCDSTETCSNGFCSDPCASFKCDKANTQCQVVNHAAVCKCKPGFRQTKDGCVQGKVCSNNDNCDDKETCSNGFCSDPCESFKCDKSNTQCQVVNHAPVCKCKPGYKQTKDGCVQGKVCSANNNCDEKESCLDGFCANPCDTKKCDGANTKCEVVNHEATCNCLPGYEQTKDGCIKKKRFYVYNDVLNWADAQKKCRDLKMELPVIDSREKNDELIKALNDAGVKMGIWLGAKFMGKTFSWYNNAPLKFVDWNSYYYQWGMFDGCVFLGKEVDQRKWGLYDCNTPINYACENPSYGKT